MASPLITVITPFYNSMHWYEKYLKLQKKLRKNGLID